MRDIKVLEIWDIQFHENCVDIAWGSNIGFGHLTIFHDNSTKIEVDKDIKYEIDSESMGEEFIFRVLDLAKQYIINHINILD